MKNPAIYLVRQFKKNGLLYEIIGRAERDVSVEEKLFLKDSNGISIFIVKDIEAFRKKIATLPQMYSGIITLELIDGNPADFTEGDFLFKE